MSRWFGKRYGSHSQVLQQLIESRRTPKLDTTYSDTLDDSDEESDQSFSLVAAPATPGTVASKKAVAPVPIDDEWDMSTVIDDTPEPLNTERDFTPKVKGRLGKQNFLTMTEPSAEAIANAKVQILQKQLDLAQDRITIHKQSEHALSKKHEAELDQYDRDREALIQSTQEDIQVLKTGHFAMLAMIHKELQRVDRERDMTIQQLEQIHEAAALGQKQTHDGELLLLKQTHCDDMKRLKDAQNIANANLYAAQETHDSVLADLRAEIEQLKLHHGDTLESSERANSLQLENQVKKLENKVFVITQLHTSETNVSARLELENLALKQNLEPTKRPVEKERRSARVIPRPHTHAGKQSPLQRRDPGSKLPPKMQGFGNYLDRYADISLSGHQAHHAKGQRVLQCIWCQTYSKLEQVST